MKSGVVAVVGRPNAGKSTLVNAIAGAKVSIVSRRRQTTRGVVRAECDHDGARIVLLDSPGWQTQRGGDFARTINGGARRAAESADAVVFMTTPRWTEEDAESLSRLPPRIPAAAAVNKIDLTRDKRALLPVADALRKLRDFAAIVPISAARGNGIRILLKEVAALLPQSPSAAAAENASPAAGDRDFMLGELLREKLFRALDGDMPYRIGVAATSRRRADVRHICAEIYVERDSQKAIVIGGGGATLKKIAASARREMERLCGVKVFLQTRVLTRPAWRRDASLLARMRIGAADASALHITPPPAADKMVK